MCGIVGAVAQRDVAEILINGLHRLEYRGYDSAGVAVVNEQHELQRVRCLGKVKALDEAVAAKPLIGGTGIAHTRWATHGEPSETNAHPHVSGNFGSQRYYRKSRRTSRIIKITWLCIPFSNRYGSDRSFS